MGWKRGFCAALTTSFALSLTGLSVLAEPLPEHRAQFDADAALCRVDFMPDESTGGSPPVLSATVDLLADKLSLSLTGGQFVQSTFIWGDSRLEVAPGRSLAADELLETDLWIAIADAAQGELPVFWTVRDIDGEYSSARYDTLGPAQIGRTLALVCDVSGLTEVVSTEIEAQRAERRLGLTEAQVQYIRGVLFDQYGEPGAQPGSEVEFTVTDRRLISAHNAQEGRGPLPFITANTAEELLATTVRTEVPDPGRGDSAASVFTDWTLLEEDDAGACSIYSTASSSEGHSGARAPRMLFSVNVSDSGGLMAFELTTPNVFSSSEAIRAVIGGTSIPLTVEPASGAVVPRPLSDGRISNEITRSIRRAGEVYIDGISRESGSPVRLTYSAMGFTAAFREMARECNRPGILGWIE